MVTKVFAFAIGLALAAAPLSVSLAAGAGAREAGGVDNVGPEGSGSPRSNLAQPNPMFPSAQKGNSGGTSMASKHSDQSVSGGPSNVSKAGTETSQ